MTSSRSKIVNAVGAAKAGQSLARELLYEQLPLVLITLAAGVVAAYWQHGFLSGADTAFPLAGVKVTSWLKTDGLSEEASAVVVWACLTVWVRFAKLLLKSVSPS